MNKNESKKSAKTEQTENAQHVETVKEPDAQSPSGISLEGPGNDDTPVDGEGCEVVTVIIVSHSDEQAGLMALSVKKNLIGVDADIHAVTGSNLEDTLAETLAGHLPHCQTERIVLMTDGMVILNPVTLSDVGMVKAVKVAGAISFDTRTPVLMHKSALDALLKEAIADQKPYIDVVDTYFRGTLPEIYRPVLLGDWKTDPWLLPIISENPSVERIKVFAEWKKFAIINPQSWSDELVEFLKERFTE